MTIAERAQEFYNNFFNKTTTHLMDVAEGLKQPTKAERDEYSMGDCPDEAAREALEPYSITKRTAYYLELAGGGPAARIRVEVEDGEIISASLQFQDWFEPWTDAPNQDTELVERYARLVGYFDG